MCSSSNVFAIGEFGSEDCLSTKIGLGCKCCLMNNLNNTLYTAKINELKITIFSLNDPLLQLALLALFDELLIRIGAAPELGGFELFGGNDGRLECGSGQIANSRFLSCIYNSIKLSNFVSTSSTCERVRARDGYKRKDFVN